MRSPIIHYKNSIKICTFLLVICLLTLPISALTLRNDVDGQYKMFFTYREDIYESEVTSQIFYTGDFGSSVCINPAYYENMVEYPLKFEVHVTFSLTLDHTSTVFLGSYILNNHGSFNLGSLSTYYDSDSDFTVNDQVCDLRAYEFSSTRWPYWILLNNVSSHRDFDYKVLYDVPPGNYSFDLVITDLYPLIEYGVSVFVTDKPADYNPLFVSSADGYASALAQLIEDYQDALNSATSDAEKTFINGYYQNQITILREGSGSTNLDYIIHDYQDSFSEIFDSYSSGSVSLSDSLISLSSLYSDSLERCSNPDEAQLLNSTQILSIERLRLESESQLEQSFDDISSDEDISFLEDYQEKEAQLVELFDVADFEREFDYTTWFDTLDLANQTELKSIYNFFLENETLKYFIIIPIVMGVCCVLLGTSIHMRRRS